MPRTGWQFFGSGGAREKVWGGGGIDSEGQRLISKGQRLISKTKKRQRQS